METGPRLMTHCTSDVSEYLDRAGDFLRSRPVEHSVLMSVAASRAAAAATETGADLWLWVTDGDQVVAAAHVTPPMPLYVSPAPAEAVAPLAHALRDRGVDLPGVSGIGGTPHAFAAEWRRLGGPEAVTDMAMGVYATRQVAPPEDVPGTLRLAHPDEADLLREWAAAFLREIEHGDEGRDEIGPRIAAGRLWVWDVDGRAVSMAGCTPAEAGSSRIQLVYTPPSERGHGYASACVAGITAQELQAPGHTVMLFTDLANPTSNGIYQAIGFERTGDAVMLRFSGR